MFEQCEVRSNKLAEVREHVRQVHSVKNLGLGVHITDEYAETLASSLLRWVLVCHYYYLQLGDSNSDVGADGSTANDVKVAQQPISRELVEQSLERSSGQ